MRHRDAEGRRAKQRQRQATWKKHKASMNDDSYPSLERAAPDDVDLKATFGNCSEEWPVAAVARALSLERAARCGDWQKPRWPVR